MSALTLPMIIYLPEYYANTLGISLSLVGVIFTVIRLADLIFDPLVGSLMDRTRTRWGQFRPWMVAGGPLVCAGAAMLFLARPGVGPVYLSAGLVLAYFGYSMVILSQMGIGTSIAPDYRERSRVFAWWQVLNTLGQILVMLVPVVFATRIANDSSFTVRAMGWFIICCVPVSILIAALTVKEGETAEPTHSGGLSDYRDLLSLPSTRLVLGTQLMLGLGLGVSAAVFLFQFTMIKQVPFEYVGLQFVAFYIVGACTAPLWSMLSNRFGKHRALVFGAAGFGTYMLLMMLMPPGNLWYFGLMAIYGGTMACAADMLPRSIMADVCDEDHLNKAQDRTGMLFALLTVTHKFGQAMSIGIVYFALDAIGFKAGSTGNSETALRGVSFLYGIIPAALYFAASFTISRFRLTSERHAEIRAALEARGMGHPDIGAHPTP